LSARIDAAAHHHHLPASYLFSHVVGGFLDGADVGFARAAAEGPRAPRKLSVGDERCSESHRKDAKDAKKTRRTWRFAVKNSLLSPVRQMLTLVRRRSLTEAEAALN